MSAYYGGKGYTTHKTALATIKASKRLDADNWYHSIIDINGNHFDIDFEDRLIINYDK